MSIHSHMSELKITITKDFQVKKTCYFVKKNALLFKRFNVTLSLKNGQSKFHFRLIFIFNKNEFQSCQFLSDCNWTRNHNHLVHKRTLN